MFMLMLVMLMFVFARSLYVCTRLSSPASFGQSPSAERPDQPSGFAHVSEASKAYLSFDTLRFESPRSTSVQKRASVKRSCGTCTCACD